MRQSTIMILLVLVSSALMITCDDDDGGPTQPQTLEQKLAALPGVSVEEIQAPTGFSQAFELSLPQPVDHENPSGQQFSQRVLISHRDESAPTVFVTSGYMVSRNRVYPIAEVLEANQVYIDHRYFGDAAPSPIVWEHLNVVQAAADCHRIVTLLSPIYTGPWVSHGVSKGGIAALFHRRYYPDDVDATVAQVAPLMFDTADARFDNFLLNEVGDADCRQRLLQFQRLVLSHRDSLLPLLEDYVSQNQLSFRLGLETAFELNTLEFLFYYWQYGPHDCSAVPDSTASIQEIYHYLQTENGIDWLQDDYMDALAPAWYQIYTEQGYYRLIHDHVADLIESPSQLSYSLFFPQGEQCSYSPGRVNDLVQWLQTGGDNILYIYGSIDPYTACAIELTGGANALKIILPDEGHQAGYNGFGMFTAEVHDSLESWLGVTISDDPVVTSANRRELTRATRGIDLP